MTRRRTKVGPVSSHITMQNISSDSIFPSIDTLEPGDVFECFGEHEGPFIVVFANGHDMQMQGLKHHVSCASLRTGEVMSLDNLTNFVLRQYDTMELARNE